MHSFLLLLLLILDKAAHGYRQCSEPNLSSCSSIYTANTLEACQVQSIFSENLSASRSKDLVPKSYYSRFNLWLAQVFQSGKRGSKYKPFTDLLSKDLDTSDVNWDNWVKFSRLAILTIILLIIASAFLLFLLVELPVLISQCCCLRCRIKEDSKPIRTKWYQKKGTRCILLACGAGVVALFGLQGVLMSKYAEQDLNGSLCTFNRAVSTVLNSSSDSSKDGFIGIYPLFDRIDEVSNEWIEVKGEGKIPTFRELIKAIINMPTATYFGTNDLVNTVEFVGWPLNTDETTRGENETTTPLALDMTILTDSSTTDSTPEHYWFTKQYISFPGPILLELDEWDVEALDEIPPSLNSIIDNFTKILRDIKSDLLPRINDEGKDYSTAVSKFHYVTDAKPYVEKSWWIILIATLVILILPAPLYWRCMLEGTTKPAGDNRVTGHREGSKTSQDFLEENEDAIMEANVEGDTQRSSKPDPRLYYGHQERKTITKVYGCVCLYLLGLVGIVMTIIGAGILEAGSLGGDACDYVKRKYLPDGSVTGFDFDENEYERDFRDQCLQEADNGGKIFDYEIKKHDIDLDSLLNLEAPAAIADELNTHMTGPYDLQWPAANNTWNALDFTTPSPTELSIIVQNIDSDLGKYLLRVDKDILRTTVESYTCRATDTSTDENSLCSRLKALNVTDSSGSLVTKTIDASEFKKKLHTMMTQCTSPPDFCFGDSLQKYAGSESCENVVKLNTTNVFSSSPNSAQGVLVSSAATSLLSCVPAENTKAFLANLWHAVRLDVLIDPKGYKRPLTNSIGPKRSMIEANSKYGGYVDHCALRSDRCSFFMDGNGSSVSYDDWKSNIKTWMLNTRVQLKDSQTATDYILKHIKTSTTLSRIKRPKEYLDDAFDCHYPVEIVHRVKDRLCHNVVPDIASIAWSYIGLGITSMIGATAVARWIHRNRLWCKKDKRRSSGNSVRESDNSILSTIDCDKFSYCS